MSQPSRQCFLCALLVGAGPESRLVMLDVFRKAGWRLREASDRKHALDCLERHPVQVVVLNAHLANWPWKQALRDLQHRARPPQLVVCSRTAGEALWAEVLNLGGYDVLVEPFERPEVERVIASARRHFEPELLPFARTRSAAAS